MIKNQPITVSNSTITEKKWVRQNIREELNRQKSSHQDITHCDLLVVGPTNINNKKQKKQTLRWQKEETEKKNKPPKKNQTKASKTNHNKLSWR